MNATKQIAALPVRKAPSGQLEVLLVTSRETGRWVVPKGWPSRRMSDAAAAAREARQEAGVAGKMKRKPLGSYRYLKADPERSRFLDVTVYVLKVEKQRKKWPEQHQRERRWFAIEEAARRVREPRLKLLLRSLNGKR